MKQISTILIFCTFPVLLAAQNTAIDVTQIDSNGLKISNQIRYFIDQSKEESIYRIPHLPKDSFKLLPEKRDFLRESRNCWFRLELVNPSAASKKIMFHYEEVNIMNLFLKEKEGWNIVNSSIHDSENNVLSGQRKFVLMNIKPHETTTLFFHKTRYGDIDFEGHIYTEEMGWKVSYEYLKKTFTKNIFRAGFLFIMGALSLFTFLQYFQHKDRSYLLYSVYLLTIFLTYLWRYSLYLQTPFSGMIASGWDIMYAQNHYLVIFFYMLFFRSFLNPNQSREKKLHKWLTYSLYIILVFMAIDLILVYNDSIALARAILNNGIPFMLICFSVLLWKIFQLPYAATRYVGLGSVALFIMAIIERWKFWGKYFIEDAQPNDIWPFYIGAMPFGILVEITFFSLALGYRTKIIQEEKQQALKDKEIEAAKSRLFTNITHEFRTPLTIIKGNTELIAKNPKRQLAERIEAINFYTDTLEHLVGDLLDLSKLEAGQVRLTKHKSDVVAYFNYLVESFASYANDNKIRLSFHTNLGAWEIDFSPQAMQQVLSNLISNALKFTPEYGQVKVYLQKTDNQLLIRVKDTGAGIKKADLFKVFEPLYQADQTVGNKIKGMGLGLAIVRQLIELLGGKIEVESELKQGTTFTILLPVTEDAPPMPKDKSLPIKKPLIRKLPTNLPPKTLGILPKLLIVEDNPDVRNYFIEILREHFTLIIATNGQEGLEIAKKEQPEFIIADEMMPEKSGFQMLQELKESPDTQHIPVIMVTAKAGREHVLQGLSLKADAYFSKPLDGKRLLLTLRNLQDKKEQATADKNLIHWQGKIVTDPFMKVALQLLEEKHIAETFNATRLKIELQRKGFGGDRKIDNLIKEHFDTTPASFLRDYRLAKAMSYLRHQLDLSIPEISDRVGLGSDQANFTKMFVKKFGVTPASVRK